ncbi:MAG: SGNH/GDSL hydrolase family protein [Actinomycetota bacterium]|nr:SGNH/GDSL hydrolase family protein [Actinomycetota bacterium]
MLGHSQKSLYVAVGASDSVGVGARRRRREAWPAVLHRDAVPAMRFINLAASGATVADALRRQMGRAVALRPSLVTVWLAVNDLAAGVAVGDYEHRLGELVQRLGGGGSTRVLVANIPYLDRLPVYLPWRHVIPPEMLNAAVDAYNDAIEGVTRREEAGLVDLHAVARAAREAGTEAALISGDGFHPSSAGHRVIAQAFAAALGVEMAEWVASPEAS